jgi:hypothetical protein
MKLNITGERAYTVCLDSPRTSMQYAPVITMDDYNQPLHPLHEIKQKTRELKVCLLKSLPSGYVAISIQKIPPIAWILRICRRPASYGHWHRYRPRLVRLPPLRRAVLSVNVQSRAGTPLRWPEGIAASRTSRSIAADILRVCA